MEPRISRFWLGIIIENCFVMIGDMSLVIGLVIACVVIVFECILIINNIGYNLFEVVCI